MATDQTGTWHNTVTYSFDYPLSAVLYVARVCYCVYEAGW
jgi:hypothetical protein